MYNINIYKMTVVDISHLKDEFPESAFCLKCKKRTGNVDKQLKVIEGKGGKKRYAMICKCSECGGKKSVFIKGGFISALINLGKLALPFLKTVGSKIASAILPHAAEAVSNKIFKKEEPQDGKGFSMIAGEKPRYSVKPVGRPKKAVYEAPVEGAGMVPKKILRGDPRFKI